MIIKVQQKPDLEARVRDREADLMALGKRDCPVQVRMVLRPLDIEHAPVLVERARPLPGVAFLTLDRSFDEGQRYAVAGIDLDTYCRHAVDLGEAFQASQVVRLGLVSLAEDEERSPLGANFGAPFQWPGWASSDGHQRQPIRPRVRRSSVRSVSGRAPKRPWR
jgi:hypothetical protein